MTDHVIEPPDPLHVDGDEEWDRVIDNLEDDADERVRLARALAVIATILAFLLGLLIGRST